MRKDHVEGLRKAARRIFWEAKNIEEGKAQEVKQAMLDLADWMLWCGYLDHGRDEEDIPGYADKPDDYVANYWDGYRDALSEFAYRIRYDNDDAYNALNDEMKGSELKRWRAVTKADVDAQMKSLGLKE